MRHGLACVLLAIFLSATQASHARSTPEVRQDLQAAFAPWDDIEALIIDELSRAKKEVLVQAYLLTSKPITAALLAAHRRDVEVKVLVDAKQLRQVQSSTASQLRAAGIGVWVEHQYQNAHNKVIIIDAALSRAVVITGSANFTWTAQHRNAENILIVRDNPALAGRYAHNWERHRNDAQALKR